MPYSRVSVLDGAGGSAPALTGGLFDILRVSSPMMRIALIGMAAPSAVS